MFGLSYCDDNSESEVNKSMQQRTSHVHSNLMDFMIAWFTPQLQFNNWPNVTNNTTKDLNAVHSMMIAGLIREADLDIKQKI